jgi:hypothetical protein
MSDVKKKHDLDEQYEVLIVPLDEILDNEAKMAFDKWVNQ